MDTATKKFKKRISFLTLEVISGSKLAEKELQKFSDNPTAIRVVKQTIKKYRKGLVGKKKINSFKAIYGNAFKPYQGGLPGQGKKS